MRVNVKATLKKVAEDKLKPKPVPKIRVKQKAAAAAPEKVEVVEPVENGVSYNFAIADEALNLHSVDSKSSLVATLWAEYHTVSTEQKKLSTQITTLVKEGATPERLKKQYDDIESYQPQLHAIRDKINYAEKHGTLPPAPEEAPEINDINALKVKAKSLVEKRSKLKRKLEKKVAKNPERFVTWEKELAMADIEWQTIEQRINELRGK